MLSIGNRASGIKVRCEGVRYEPAPCPDCGGDVFAFEGRGICQDCTGYAVAAAAAVAVPRVTRDEAFEKVDNLMRWHAARLVRHNRAGHGVGVREAYQEIVLEFWRNWDWFDGDPAHLTTYVTFSVQHATKLLRRHNRAPLGVPLDAPGGMPGGAIPDREHQPGPDPEQLARLRAALAALPPDRRADVEKAFGLNGRRKHAFRELGGRRGGGRVSSQAGRTRVQAALQRLAVLMAKGGAPC